MDYCGGTYVAQVKEASPSRALRVWASQLNVRDIANFDEACKQTLIEDFQDEQIALLNGQVNVWCATALLPKGLVLVNIVATDSSINI